MFLIKIIEQCEKHKIQYALVGGYALALHGAVRATADVDLVLKLDKIQFSKFADAMNELGLSSRLPLVPEQIIEFRQEYIEKRNLIAWSFINLKNPLEIVDVIITEDLKTMKTIKIHLGKHLVRVASVEDLIRMKKTSGRPQDLVDIERLKQIYEKSKK